MKWFAIILAVFAVFAAGMSHYYARQALAAARAAHLGAADVLDRCIEVIQRADTSDGVCCCGDDVKSHGYHSGHGPVDAGDYFASGVLVEARQVRDELRALL